MALGYPFPHVHTYPVGTGTVIRMSGTYLELTEVASILTEDHIIWGSLTSWPGIMELCVALGSPSPHVHIYPVGAGNCHQNVRIHFRTYRGGIHLP